MKREILLTVKCDRKRHVLATVVGETEAGDDAGIVYIEAPKHGRSRRHGVIGKARRREYIEGSGSRYGCACGSTLLRDAYLRRAVRDGYTEIITPVR